jgi:hypothetical protein
MRLGRCPTCHAHLDLASMVEDEAGRELMSELAKLPTRLAGSLLSYLCLFRPEKQDLRNSRSLGLLRETLSLCSDHYLLGAAVEQTSQQLQQQRLRGAWRPLTSHGYLRQVMAGIAERAGQEVMPATTNTTSSISPEAARRQEEEAYCRQMAALGLKVDSKGKLVPLEPDDE